MKHRRQRRVIKDWAVEIAKGNTNQFYNSTDWDILREFVLNRDKHLCQFFLGKWNDGTHFPDEIKFVEAKHVHHIISIKQRPDLALDPNNCISLSFLAHEIIEERIMLLNKKQTKKFVTDEWW